MTTNRHLFWLPPIALFTLVACGEADIAANESSYPPWAVGIIGNQDESTITLTKTAAQ